MNIRVILGDRRRRPTRVQSLCSPSKMLAFMAHRRGRERSCTSHQVRPLYQLLLTFHPLPLWVHVQLFTQYGMQHRKRRKTKQQSIQLPNLALLGSSGFPLFRVQNPAQKHGSIKDSEVLLRVCQARALLSLSLPSHSNSFWGNNRFSPSLSPTLPLPPSAIVHRIARAALDHSLSLSLSRLPPIQSGRMRDGWEGTYFVYEQFWKQ